jgi:hypothetical protein
MPILTSSESLKNMINEGILNIIQKRQKMDNAYNYYFTPNLAIEVYNPKVSYAHSKYFILTFEKKTNLAFLLMLRKIDEYLKSYLQTSYIIDPEHVFYNLYGEQPETFTLRCSLPQIRNKYLVTCKFGDESVEFSLPRNNVNLKKITFEIRNVWNANNKLGYNLEVKFIDY